MTIRRRRTTRCCISAIAWRTVRRRLYRRKGTPPAGEVPRGCTLLAESRTAATSVSDTADIAKSASGVCRLCGARLAHTLVDLGKSPLCETFLDARQIDQMEPFYPLHVLVCDQCWLVQLKEYVTADG